MTSDTQHLIVQVLIAVLPAAVGGFFVVRQATKTARVASTTAEAVAAQNAVIELNKVEIERRRMDDEAVMRARVTYEKILEEMRAELTRMHTQVERVQTQYDRVTVQLASEQDVSNQLRSDVAKLRRQVDELQAQISSMESLIARLKATGAEHITNNQ